LALFICCSFGLRADCADFLFCSLKDEPYGFA
jgi:hypothetical protein